MHIVYNKCNVFYLIDLHKNTVSLIGDKDELIKFIARSSLIDERRNRIISDYFLHLNMGNDLNIIHHKDYVKDDFDCTHVVYKKIIDKKQYMFVDGENRTIDVRLFEDEIIARIRNDECDYTYHRYVSRKQRRHYYSGWVCRHRNPKLKNVKLGFSTYQYSDLKEYGIKISNPLKQDIWYYCDKGRRISANWKHQYKARKQYNIHCKQKTDLRKNKYIEDFSQEEIDAMLEEDFLSK